LTLEIVDKGAETQTHPVPLLFVHGGMHAAWCWERGFTDYFVERGHRTLAVSLRGHGESPAPARRRRSSIADYVADVNAAAISLPVRPVVIGHSMGGFVVQKYLEVHPAPGAVLLASMPPSGTSRVLLRAVGAQLALGAAHVGGGLLSTLRRDRTPRIAFSTKVVRATLFSQSTPESDVIWCAKRLTDATSARAVLDMMFLDGLRRRNAATPLLVLGAADDHLISRRQVHRTARAYGTHAELIAGVGHDIMLESCWPAVAERINEWLRSHHL